MWQFLPIRYPILHFYAFLLVFHFVLYVEFTAMLKLCVCVCVYKQPSVFLFITFAFQALVRNLYLKCSFLKNPANSKCIVTAAPAHGANTPPSCILGYTYAPSNAYLGLFLGPVLYSICPFMKLLMCELQKGILQCISIFVTAFSPLFCWTL